MQYAQHHDTQLQAFKQAKERVDSIEQERSRLDQANTSTLISDISHAKENVHSLKLQLLEQENDEAKRLAEERLAGQTASQEELVNLKAQLDSQRSEFNVLAKSFFIVTLPLRVLMWLCSCSSVCPSVYSGKPLFHSHLLVSLYTHWVVIRTDRVGVETSSES